MVGVDVERSPRAYLTGKYSNVERLPTLRRYRTTGRHICPIKDCCTTDQKRRIIGSEHENVLEAVPRRLDEKTQ
jgi:hypothetical protein